jgi:DNA-binding response OmpR family regulator
MPYVDGRQVASFVKRESPSTPLVMLTGWGTVMKEDGDLPAHVDVILSKPPRAEEVREALRKFTAEHNGSTPGCPTPAVAEPMLVAV